MNAIPENGAWRIEPLWSGETVFIVCGGASVRGMDLDVLKGRRVVAVNSSYERVAFADVVFFGDNRWWIEHQARPAMQAFPGRVATCSDAAHGARLLKLRRVTPGNGQPGFADDRDAVASQRTSLQGAMNMAAHLGARKIVLIGADAGRAPDGTSHHHKPHKWPNRPGNTVWDEQLTHLRLIVEPLQRLQVEVINTSLVSRIPWWPKVELSEFLRLEAEDAEH